MALQNGINSSSYFYGPPGSVAFNGPRGPTLIGDSFLYTKFSTSDGILLQYQHIKIITAIINAQHNIFIAIYYP